MASRRAGGQHMQDARRHKIRGRGSRSAIWQRLPSSSKGDLWGPNLAWGRIGLCFFGGTYTRG